MAFPSKDSGHVRPVENVARKSKGFGEGDSGPSRAAAGSVAGVTVGAMALSRDEREQFLAEPHIGALSVVESPDRAPLIVPIWYQYEPGGELWISTGTESRKAKAIQAAGRFSLLVERTEPTVRYVSVEGPVTRISPGNPEQSREIAARYLPADKVEKWLEYERTQLPEHVTIHLRPERWASADLGGF
jgi:hypothetical protein